MSVSQLHRALEEVVGPGGVISDPDELVVYECDGFTIPRARPLAVVFPKSSQEVSGVVKVLAAQGVAMMARQWHRPHRRDCCSGAWGADQFGADESRSGD